VFDFARDQLFETQVAEVRVTERYKSDVPPYYYFEAAIATLNQNFAAAKIDYRGASQLLTVTFGTETTEFPKTSIEFQTADGLQYHRLNDGEGRGFRIVRPGPSFQYSSFSRQTHSGSGFPDAGSKVGFDIERYFLLGAPTLVSDLPSTGTASYSAGLLTSTVTYDGGSGLGANGTLSFNFATHQVSGTFAATQGAWRTGTTPVSATLVFSGTEQNGTLKGQITSPNSGYVGEFVGRLFGPQGTELGLVFTIVRDGKGSIGQLAAKKP
jgi:hypothetical protein